MEKGTDVVRGDRQSWWGAFQCAASMPPRDRRNLARFGVWFFGWTISFGLGSLVLKYEPGMNGIAVWAVALGPNVLAVLALFAYVRFLREADELMRRIQIEGLAFGCGAGLFFTMGYGLLELIGAPELPFDYGALPILLGWSFGQLIAAWRYR